MVPADESGQRPNATAVAKPAPVTAPKTAGADASDAFYEAARRHQNDPLDSGGLALNAYLRSPARNQSFDAAVTSYGRVVVAKIGQKVDGALVGPEVCGGEGPAVGNSCTVASDTYNQNVDVATFADITGLNPLPEYTASLPASKTGAYAQVGGLANCFTDVEQGDSYSKTDWTVTEYRNFPYSHNNTPGDIISDNFDNTEVSVKGIADPEVVTSLYRAQQLDAFALNCLHTSTVALAGK